MKTCHYLSTLCSLVTKNSMHLFLYTSNGWSDYLLCLRNVQLLRYEFGSKLLLMEINQTTTFLDEHFTCEVLGISM